MSRRSTISAGAATTQGGGIAPGPRMPIDGNTLAAYFLDITSGTIIPNEVSPGTGDLTLTGTPGVDYILDDRGLYQASTSAIRWLGGVGNASTAGQSFVMTGDTTLEYVVAREWTTPASIYGCPVQAVDGPAPPLSCGIGGAAWPTTGGNKNHFAALAYWTTGLGLQSNDAFTDEVPVFSPRMHVAAIVRSSSVELWINGALIQSDTAGPITTLTRLTVGNDVGLARPFRGLIGEVRLSNIARDAAYLQEATRYAGNL